MKTDEKNLSVERRLYLHNEKRRKVVIRLTQIGILAAFIALWEIGAQVGFINSFIMSSPSRILSTFLNLSSNGLLTHLGVTLYETLIGFSLGAVLGVGLAIILWWSESLSKVCEPFLVILNSLPKIALGPVIIVWVGAGTGAIIFMAVAISLIVTVLEMLNGFKQTNKDTIRMANSFSASTWQIFTKIVFPSNLSTLFSALKVNIGLTLVGVIAGEFLVSKAGLGYLIVYGGQVFKLDLVMASVIILAIVAAALYQAVLCSEKLVKRFFHKK